MRRPTARFFFFFFSSRRRHTRLTCDWSSDVCSSDLAIEKVAGGEGYVDPALMPAFLTGREKDDMLTAREREILQLLADGMSNADVAAKLFISQETVKSHVRHILA